ncbi:helix-turn-helix transcriptional regulator [Cohaesibacter gelatinilyticus]|uniref:Predicted DNA-binding transcriptional regulator YafY, contains an HTH and WYL domains n=1 Tax=Cohaesibacter gelatinilyticus TaxID=372072 RepID=A0A285NEK8_9HYPH|nr:YafY family protein [Cohaesibacter gelatinilyticus]SNZ06081.1 Predicted DNA-binding transcriptional regulator YafY, contains an HTH and WYL domains [Cohaesibacter gelatinilyticus]HAT86967.1 YafY family transcriptional regulator [Hyphomicrobiales bacterium]
MRTIRLFSILDQLRGRRTPISAENLAERLGVSVRTIYRDMKTLQSMGAPIRGEGGLGYQLEDGFFLPPLHFEPQELDVLLLGIRMVAARGDNELAETADRLLGKIEDVLKGGENNLDQPLLAVKPVAKPNHAFGMSQLKASIRLRLKVKLQYLDGQQRKTSRLVRPLGLTAFEKVWVLTAWCETRDDFRNFRLDRISDFEVTQTKFKRDKGKEFSDYLKSL